MKFIEELIMKIKVLREQETIRFHKEAITQSHAPVFKCLMGLRIHCNRNHGGKLVVSAQYPINQKLGRVQITSPSPVVFSQLSSR